MEQKSEFFFSVITVCLNVEKTIRMTMESVMNQTWQNFEYIIVDGGSSDATLSTVKELAAKDRRIQWRSEPDSGIYNAMNKGIRRAAGDYLLFLNAGDEFYSDNVLAKAAQVAAGADIIIGDMVFRSETGMVKVTYSAGAELLENLRKGRSVCHQVIFASKQCLADGFDENYMFCADYDWLCRQVNAGKRVIKLDAVVVNFDTHGVTFQVRHQKRHWKEYFEIIGKNFPRLEFAYGNEVKTLFVQQRKDHILYEFMNRWLALKQRGIDFSTYFSRQGMQSIAIYGIHHMGKRLCDELRDSDVKVAYVIDRNRSGTYSDIQVLHPDDLLKPVDVVVITPILDFMEIKETLSARLECPMIFIEDVLFYEYEHIEAALV